MDDRKTPAESLLEIAKGMEKLAEALEMRPERKAPLPDYGKLGETNPAGADPLTGFLLS